MNSSGEPGKANRVLHLIAVLLLFIFFLVFAMNSGQEGERTKMWVALTGVIFLAGVLYQKWVNWK